MDFDSTYPLVSSEVNVFDLFGNLTASPASHATLKAQYTVGDIRKLMGLDTVLSRLNTMSTEDISQFFRVDSVRFPAVGPDTLRPRYPTVIQINYEYLRRMCGPNSQERICVPAWNCLNAKGRLVAPGGYIVVQHILAGGKMATTNKKLIVTSGERNK
jgi:hypothetical protein